jgi:hypothetical protein
MSADAELVEKCAGLYQKMKETWANDDQNRE